ncbi:MAG: N-acetylmuramoyl-L-alanine amidase family protein, partial [Planctomycetota bacterium]
MGRDRGAWVGCDPWDPWANKDEHSVVIAPYSAISVYQLADRLAMTVVDGDGRTATLRNSGPETVLISAGLLADHVYVNGQQIDFTGDILPADGVLFVPETLEQTLRDELAAVSIRRPPDPVTPPPAPAPRPVVIDAGHGGHDDGAAGIVGIPEKQVNLAVAMRLAELLRQRHVPVLLTRDRDVFIELDERADIANRNRATLFVSLHADSFTEPGPNGFTVFIAEKADDRARVFGEIIERQFTMLGITNRGVRRRDLRVLVRSSCPTVLVEMGFLTNPAEARALTSG